MANERIALGINLRQNKNSRNAGYGKYYPVVDQQKTLSLRGFAEHMVSHGSLYNRGVVEGVLNQICECLPELLAQGVPVKLGSLGIFYPTAQVEKNGAVDGYAGMDGLNPATIVQGIRIRFRPDSTKLDNICGPKFKERCSLELRNIVDTQEVTLGGKTRKVQTLRPVATAVAEWKAREALGGNDDPDFENGANGGASSNSGSGTETVRLTVSAGSGGRVKIGDGEYDAGANTDVAPGTSVSISAQPNAGYSFSQWSDGNTSASRSVTVSEAMTLTASFTLNSGGSGAGE
jgi:hypothetical protein